MEKQKEVWIGLLGVKPKPGNDLLSPGALGAYVQTLAWASSEKDFLSEIIIALNHLRFELDEYSDLETMNDRAHKFHLENALLELAEDVRRTGEVRFGTFNNYSADGSLPS